MLFMQLLEANGGPHCGSLQLGLIHHNPNIGIESSEMSGPGPSGTAVPPHQLSAHHLIEGANNDRLLAQGINVIVLDLSATEHEHRNRGTQTGNNSATLSSDLAGQCTQRQLIDEAPWRRSRMLLPIP